MIGKILSRNELRQVTGGGVNGCLACFSTCIYEPDGPGAGCPPGGNCVLKECPSMDPYCPDYQEYRYYARCDWEA